MLGLELFSEPRYANKPGSIWVSPESSFLIQPVSFFVASMVYEMFLISSETPWSQRFFPPSSKRLDIHAYIHGSARFLKNYFERTDKEKPLGPVSSSAASKFRDWYWPSRAYSLNAHQMPFQNLVSQVGRRRLRTKFSVQSVATTHGNQLRRLKNSILHVFDTNGHLVPRSLC